ncbi:putative DNA binding domain-containing protein [Candidatus Uhrbacteria bacterium]|nr:putative DNA binding domain-containing protein [Candidatus Uhrbacteria bacterium]
MNMFDSWSTEKCIEYAATTPEGQTFERKRAAADVYDIANLVIAFANADGGIIAIGVEDDGKISGFTRSGEKAAIFRKNVAELIEPPVRYEIMEVPCINASGNTDFILLIEVERGVSTHLNTRDECFLRVENTTNKLTFEERKELEYDKDEARYESRVIAGSGLVDIDADTLTPLNETLHYTDSLRTLRAMHLIEEKDGSIFLTVAGLLLFGSNPQTKLPKSTIRILRYEGKKMETGERLNIVKDKVFDGNLLQQVSRASALIQSLLREFSSLDIATGKFTAVLEYPRAAWLEAIVNAIVHRSYSLGGAGIEVKIFDDRFEVHSPGNLPHSIRVENIRSTHCSRNPNIVNVFHRLGIVRELGEGMDRMFDEMKAAGLPEPIIEAWSGRGWVTVTLFNDIEHRRPWVLDVQKVDIIELKNQAVDKEELQIINLAVANGGRITTVECMGLLEITRPTAIEKLRALAAKAILIEVRESSTDPGAFFAIDKKYLLK